jgi:hypothetical protein
MSSEQHGFMTGRSCLTNLLETFESWTKALDEGYGLDIIYLDYRKAFDSVPHVRLIEKLKTWIKGKLLVWIADFLKSRSMRVELRGVLSELIDVLSGVPQGSVLGPLLFFLYVNELPNWIKNNMRMFADDTKVWKTITEISDGVSLQEDLNRLSEWSERWMIQFNTEKCKIMHVGHNLDTKYFMKISTGTTELKAITEEKDLGIYVGADLKASIQCVKAAAKARRIIGMVKRNFQRLQSGFPATL